MQMALAMNAVSWKNVKMLAEVPNISSSWHVPSQSAKQNARK